MDILNASLLSIFIVIVSFSLHYFVYHSKSTKVHKLLPHGTTKWPIIGESMDFLRDGWKGHPERFILDRMAKFSPIVFRTSLMLQNVAVFCGANGNKFLFSNENKLVQIWWPISVDKIFISNKSNHKTQTSKLRMLLANFMKAEALRRYVPIMDIVAQQHFANGWDGKEEVMTFELIKQYTFMLVCKIFLSLDELERVRHLHEHLESIVTGMSSFPIDLPGTALRRGMNAANFVRKELEAVVRKRKIDLDQGKASPTQDILSHMIVHRDENGESLDDYDIADKILGLLIGGHETSTSAITFIVKYLAELPEVYNGVYQEQMEIAKSKAPGELLNWEDLSKMKYSWRVACEVMRLVPPVQGNFREAITDFTYDGYFIPKGWKLYWSVNSTHKNHELFPEPQKFDPSRFEGKGPAPYTFVPFGGGPHMCPGKEYARLEILVFVHHLVKRFKWEKVIPHEKIVFPPIPRPAKGLPVRIYPHKV